MPKVSVIVPIYGVEKYIERCAISLFSQSLDDIEYIFVNDCTKDSSIEILNRTILKYPNRSHQIRIINLTKNGGLPNARKVGIGYATGEYIIHCDSDDWVDIQAYEKLYKEAIKGNFDIIFCDYFHSNGITKKRRYRKFKKFKTNNIEETVASHYMWNLWGALVKRTIYNYDIIYPKSNNGEDFALMFQLMYYAKSYSYVDEPLYYYYYNPQSITKDPGIDNYIKRMTQHRDNVELLASFYSMKGKSLEYFNILFVLKLFCRVNFSAIVKEYKMRKIWYSIFPEIEQTSFIFNIHIPLNLKFHYWEERLKVYTLLLHKK